MGGPKFRVFFPLSPFSLFCLPLRVFSWNFGGPGFPKTPPKFHEKTPRERQKRAKFWVVRRRPEGGLAEGSPDGGGSCRADTHTLQTQQKRSSNSKSRSKEAKQQQQQSSNSKAADSKAATAKQQQQSSNSKSKAATAKQQQQQRKQLQRKQQQQQEFSELCGVIPTVCWPPVCCLCLTLSFAANLSKLACLCAMHQVPQRGAHHGTRRTRTSTAQEGSYGPNSPSLRMGEQAMRKVQFPGPLKTFNSSRAAGGGGSGDHAALKKARAALAAAQDADFPQSFIDELAQEVQCRRKEREQKKNNWCKTGLSLRSLGESAREVPGSRGRRCGGGRHAGQYTRSGQGAAGTSPHRMREGGQRDGEQDDGGGVHEALRNVLDSVEKAWPPGAQTTAGLQEAVSVARATLQARRTGNSTHEKPQLKMHKKQQRRRIESLKTDEGSNGDPDDVSDGFDGRGLRATFPWNTVSMRDHATSSNDRGKTTDALETKKKNVSTLHNCFHAKQKHAEECTQESTPTHPEARSSPDFDMTQISEPTTTADGHLDKARKAAEAECNMSKSDYDAHTEHMQIDTQEDYVLECIFSKKHHCTTQSKHHMRDLPRGKEQRIKDASL